MITYPPVRMSPFEPPELFGVLRRDSPVTKVQLSDGSEAWLVTRYEDIRAGYADLRLSSVATRPGYPHLTAGIGASKRQDTSFLRQDPPEHDVQRRMVAPSFSVRRVEALRPKVQRIVDDVLDRMLEGSQPADLIQAFALPVPSLVICELLGVPYSDHEFFQDKSMVTFQQSATPEDVTEAVEELNAYLRKLITAKATDPGEDLLSDLVAEQMASGSLSEDEIIVMARLMLTAGHETTANMIGLATFLLLYQGDILDELRADPALVPGAVDELLRYTSIAHMSPVRVAKEDTEIGGQVVRAGEGVILPLSAANWDGEVFPNPDRLDIRRGARNHMAFGYGPHTCVGQPLARMELQVVVGTLFPRIPTIALVDPV
jgi:cytochrome P450